MLRRTLCFLLAPVLVLAACGDDEPTASDRTTTSSEAPSTTALAPGEESSLDDIEVTPGEEGTAPTLDFEQPFRAATTGTRILEQGDGAEIAEDDIVVFDFIFVNGRDGREISSSFTEAVEPAEVVVNAELLAGLHKGLIGLTSGTTAIIAVAPVDGFADQGDDPTSGINADDTLLIYLDIHEVRRPLARAEGTPVEPAPGLPGVQLDDAGAPTITVPGGEPPAELVIQPLIEGAGPAVESGQTITVHYTGVLWDGGEQFDSSWEKGTPASFPIGTGGVIPGWDKGLVGQTIGSQVLLVIPPEDGYPDGQGSIPAGATLVFVVDILDAR